jgi:hypothetical protein
MCRSAVLREGVEVVHLDGADLAPLGAALRRRLAVPVTAHVSARVHALKSPSVVRALQRLDQLFVSDELVHEDLRVRGVRVATAVTPPAAMTLPEPSERALRSVVRSLRGVQPGRLVVGLPAPAAESQLRWFRDAVLPRLAASPVCLLFGVTDRRQTRRIVDIVGAPEVRVHAGRANTETIAAIGRCVDAFVTASPESHPVERLLDLAVTGAPIVAAGRDLWGVLHDERSAFVVVPGDDAAFVSTLDRLLALPAQQRHALGEGFAGFTMDRHPPESAHATYAARFRALAGRAPTTTAPPR